MTRLIRHPILPLILALAVATFAGSAAQAQVTATMSKAVAKAISTAGGNPAAELTRINALFKAGLKAMAAKNAGAKDLYTAKQTIKIICYTDPAAGKREKPVGILAEPAESVGDFTEGGGPKPGGTAVFIIDCGTIQARGGFFKKPESTVTQPLFTILVHELLHATNKKRVHNGEGTDPLELYRKWERDFLAELTKLGLW